MTRTDEGTRAAIVTGGGTGLGRATVTALAASGVDCVVAGRRADPLDEVVEHLADHPGRVVAVAEADVADEADRQRIVTTCLDEFGRVDILVNNAGTSHQAPLLDFSLEDWREVMACNLDAPFFLSQLVLEDMRKRSWGRIVNIASVYGSLGFNASLYGDLRPDTSPGDRGPVRAPAYHVSKGGLLNLTRELAIAVAPWGVTVNTVSPGMVPLPTSNLDDEAARRLQDMTPLKRFGTPPEIGAVVRFLASEESSFMTGADVVVDGGWSIW